MANEKQYASWIDIPGGNGGTERKYLRDDDAQAELLTKASLSQLEDAALIPVDVSALTPSTTFPKNSVIGINGVWYKAKSATNVLPFTLVTQDGAFVMQELGGVQVFIIADPTLNSSWMPWSDASVQGHLNDLDTRMAAIETMNWSPRLESLEQITQSQGTTIGQHSQQIAAQQATIGQHSQQIATQQATLGQHSQQIAALQAATASVTYNGQTYTLQMIMAEMAKLMEGTVIIQSAES